MINDSDQKVSIPQILVVDDTPANLKLLTDILRNSGYQVRPASSGRLALRSVAVEAPDLILLDVRMPEMDGYEVCHRLKSEEQSRGIPVIFISAMDETADKIKGFNAGGIDYITKPFEATEVLARVETHVALHRLQKQLEVLVDERTADLRKTNEELQREIAERKRVAEALRESEKRLSDIIDFLPDATFAIDRDGKIIAWNRAIEEMTGFPAEQMLGKGDHEYSVPFYGIQRPILIDLVFKSNEEIESTYSLIDRKGNIVLAEGEVPVRGKNRLLSGVAGPLCDSKGNIVGAIESTRDITERKQAEEAFKSLIYSAPLGISVVQDDLFKLVNQGFQRTTGYNESELTGKDSLFLVAPEYKETVKAKVMQLLEGQSVPPYEYKIIHKNGESRWVVERIISTLFDGKRAVLGYFMDITARKKAEETLTASKSRFREILNQSAPS